MRGMKTETSEKNVVRCRKCGWVGTDSEATPAGGRCRRCAASWEHLEIIEEAT